MAGSRKREGKSRPGEVRIEVVREARRRSPACPDCAGDGWTRRTFLRTVGAIAGAAVLPIGDIAFSAAPKDEASGAHSAESLVKHLFESLKPEQRKVMHFPFDHKLRSFISNNWDVVDPQVGAIGKLYTSDQKETIRRIFRGVTSEDGYDRFQKQMKDDNGGFENYTCAIFGEPGEAGRFEWVMTGRHLTVRADGNSVKNTAFGGPIFYGHAVQFDEKPDHPGNVWWHQARLANGVFQSLDGKQREKALLAEDPPDDESTVILRGKEAEIAGLPGSELTKDQKENLRKTLLSMLSMYRASDVEEALACLEKDGGADSLHMSFYKAGDLGSDGIWDRWRVEGPHFVWYFRGSPHVHAWVHIAEAASSRKAKV